MTAREFCYWLQGYFELYDAGNPPGANVCLGIPHDKAKVIRQHLAMVFRHEIDPSYPDSSALSKIHGGDVQPRC